MESLVEKYKALTTRKVVAPSKFEFTIRGLTPTELIIILDGLPTFVPESVEEAGAEPASSPKKMAEVIKNNIDQNKLIVCAVVEEIYDDADGKVGIGVPYSMLTLDDVTFLIKEVNMASGLEGRQANDARRVLPEAEQAVPAS